MKNLSYCDSIEHILISEKINCDAIVVSDEFLQYTILYRSELTKTFTDQLLKSGLFFIIRKYLIHSIPSKTSFGDLTPLKHSLLGINLTLTIYDIIANTKKYNEEKQKLKNLKLPKYIKFYSTNSNSFIFLNRDLININFSDSLQISINPNILEGSYICKENNHVITIYKDHLNGNYKINNQEISCNNILEA